MFKKQWIAVVLAGCLGTATSLNAQNISIKNYFYRDFLDMGQNKGVFAAGQSGIRLDSVKNPGVSVSFSMPFLDQSARSNQGAATALGRNFAVTANHVDAHTNASNAPYHSWGSTNYGKLKPEQESKKYSNDVKFLRYNKYIVEGNTELLQTSIQGTTQTTGTDDSSVSQSDKQKEQQNIQAIKEALQDFAVNGKVQIFQAGQGELTLREGEGGGFSQEGIKGSEGMRGGAFGEFDLNNLSYRNLGNERGPSFTYVPDKDMQNSLTRGDSGSGIFAYNPKTQKWVLLGISSEVVLSTWGRSSLVIQSDFDDYKNKFEQKIDLKNSKWTLDSTEMNNGTWVGIQGDKDLIFQNGGTIEFKRDIDRNQSGQVGGFVFEGSESGEILYKLTSQNGKTYGFNGAGLDIGKNAKVEWGLGFIDKKTGKNDALHKVGEGTLVIKTNDSKGGATNQHIGYLRVGEGKVIFDTDKQAFQGVYITSGRGTIELVKGKGGEAFGAVKDNSQIDSKIQNMFKLEQSHNENMGLTFGNGGGTLDLKGNSFTMNTIVSNDAKANIINTDSETSYFVLEGYGYNHHVEGAEKGKKTQNKADTIIHASFGQSADSKDVSNIVLMYSGNSQDEQSKNAHLVFDGNINAKGLEVTDGNVTLQGHPTTHAYIRDEKLVKKIQQAEGSKLPSWVDLSRPSTLEQPDWDHRTFKIEKIDLQKSNFNLGRESTLEAAIKADSGSKINFGGDIYHFADKKDGENVIADGFGSYQVVEKDKLKDETQKLANQSIHFKGSIEATGSEINSSIYDFNAKLDLKNNAKLKADYLILDRGTHTSGAIASLTGSNTKVEVKNLIFKGLNGSNHSNMISVSGNDSKFSVSQSIGFDNSTFNLGNLDSITGFTKPTNYDLFVKNQSQITGNTQDITGNVGVMSGSTLSLKNITLKETAQSGQTTESSLKNSIIVEGNDSSLSVDKIKSEQQDNTSILVVGDPITKGKAVTKGATLTTTNGIELNGTQAQGVEKSCGDKFGANCFADNAANSTDSKANSQMSSIYAMQGGKIESNLKTTNLKLNVHVDKDSSFLGKDKTLNADKSSIAVNLELGKEQEFSITADNKSHIALNAWAGATYANDEEKIKNALQDSAFKGAIEGKNGSVIDSNLGNITASVNLEGGSKLNIATGNVLTLKDNLNSITLKGENTALNADTIVADSLNKITFDIQNNAQFNVKDFVFKGGNVTTSKYYGENVWLQDNANLTLEKGGTIAHNLYIDSKSSFTAQPNDALLSGGKHIVVAGESAFKVGGSGNGTLGISETGETKIQTEIGSKLEIDKLLADKGSSVYVSLDLEKAEKPENPISTSSKATSTQKNFNIEARNNSNVYVNSWNMNRESFSSGNTSLTTDDTSRIHFGILTHDMAQANKTNSPINANISVSQNLKLDNVGKATNSGGKPYAQGSHAGANSRDITSNNAQNPMNQQHSESDPAKLAAQVGTTDDRFHALKLQGNTMSNGVVQNNGKNLTLDNGTRIDVNLDSSVSLDNANKGDFKLNEYYTLISAGSITDNRSDKRIYFNFAGGTSLYWVTIVENGEVKVKFTKEDPSSYNELKGYIDNDKLLEILIQHNPQNDFVQMAGTANQHNELEGYLAGLNSNMNSMAEKNISLVSNKILNANNETINARVMQVKVMQPTFGKHKLAMMSAQAQREASAVVQALDSEASMSDVASDVGRSGFEEIALVLEAIEAERTKNNAWINVGGGYFGGSGNLVFYGTNLGYDRLVNIGDNELLIGAMAGIGGSNYNAGNIKDNSLYYNVGFYVNGEIDEVHEVQSNMTLSYIDSNKTMDAAGAVAGDSMRNGAFGWLWSNYYKYRFDVGQLGEFKQVVKPIGVLNLGFNGIGAFGGTTYKQKAYNDFNLSLGAGAEYSIVKPEAIYSVQLIAKQGVYSSGDQIFVSLSNAQNFMGYDLRNNTLGFQLNFIGYNRFHRDMSLQYGISSLFDIQGNFGVKGDVRLEYRF